MTTDELIAICEAAGDEPWEKCEFLTQYGRSFAVKSPRGSIATGIEESTAAFIAAAREHFPACLRRVKELTAELAEAEAIIGAASAVDVIHFDGDETGHSQINVDRAASEQRLHDLLAARREKGGAK